MKHTQTNWILRLIFTLFHIGFLCMLSLHGQNFLPYSNQEIEKTQMYIKGNVFQKDFLLFVDLLQKCHPAFAPESNPPFDIDTVLRNGYQWADSCHSAKELWRRIQQTLTLLNDGHTTLMPDININMIYPIVLFFNDNGVHIRGINEEHKQCLGKQISQFNGHSLKEVFDGFRKITSSDNENYFKNKLATFIQLHSMWEYTPYYSPDSILHISFTDGTNISVPPISRDKIKIVMQESPVDNRSIRQNSKTPFIYTVIKDKRICYLQFNACMDQNSVRWQYLTKYPDIPASKLEELVSKYPRFDTFLNEMFETIRRDSIKTLIIDVRNNVGGNSALCDTLLSHLKSDKYIKRMHSFTRFSELWKQQYPALAAEYEMTFAKLNQPLEMGKLYDNYKLALSRPEQKVENLTTNNEDDHSIFKGKVIFIQDAQTYSSAGILITLAQDNNIGTIIGEKSSYKPCNYGDILAWQLPNTQLKGYVSHKIFIRPNIDKCNEDHIAPTVHLSPDWEDLIKGKDICWEWILDNVE